MVLVVWLNAGFFHPFRHCICQWKREIWLQGEAYLDVAQLQEKPFEVHTGPITTQVLGTTFNIDAYDVNGNIAVTVKSGKVAVHDSIKLLAQLLPDQQIVCLPDGSFRKGYSPGRRYDGLDKRTVGFPRNEIQRSGQTTGKKIRRRTDLSRCKYWQLFHYRQLCCFHFLQEIPRNARVDQWQRDQHRQSR